MPSIAPSTVPVIKPVLGNVGGVPQTGHRALNSTTPLQPTANAGAKVAKTPGLPISTTVKDTAKKAAVLTVSSASQSQSKTEEETTAITAWSSTSWTKPLPVKQAAAKQLDKTTPAQPHERPLETDVDIAPETELLPPEQRQEDYWQGIVVATPYASLFNEQLPNTVRWTLTQALNTIDVSNDNFETGPAELTSPASHERRESKSAETPATTAQTSSDPLWNRAVTKALGSYATKLFFNKYSKSVSNDTVRTISDLMVPELPIVPCDTGAKIKIQGNNIILGGQAMSSEWVIPLSTPAKAAEIIPFRTDVRTQPTDKVSDTKSSGTIAPLEPETVAKADIVPLPTAAPTTKVKAESIPSNLPALWQKYRSTPPDAVLAHWKVFNDYPVQRRSITLDPRAVPELPAQDRQTTSQASFGAQSAQAQQESHPELSEDEQAHRERVIAELEKAGYLMPDQAANDNDNVSAANDNRTAIRMLRPIRDYSDGKILLNLLAGLTSPDGDLFDLLFSMEFRWNIKLGEWCDAHKDINASLRTYSDWKGREGSKEASLIHPTGGRANIVIQINELFQEMPRNEILEFLRIDEETMAKLAQAETPDDVVSALPTTSILARLLIEVDYMGIFLKRDAWLKGIFAGHDLTDRQNRLQRLETLNEMTEQAVWKSLGLLVAAAKSGSRSTRRSA